MKQTSLKAFFGAGGAITANIASTASSAAAANIATTVSTANSASKADVEEVVRKRRPLQLPDSEDSASVQLDKKLTKVVIANETELVQSKKLQVTAQAVPKEDSDQPSGQMEAEREEAKIEEVESQREEEGQRVPVGDRRRIDDSKYDPVRDAPFCRGEPVPFSYLVDVFELIATIKGKDSKLTAIDILARMFRTILVLGMPAHRELLSAYYFCILKIAPDYEQNDLGVGKEILKKAISQSSGRDISKITAEMQKEGDLGIVAANSKRNQKTMHSYFSKNKTNEAQNSKLSVVRVIETMREIAKAKGDQSNQLRQGKIQKLLFDATAEECKYIVRFIDKNLKIGCAEKTMQAGLTRACYDYARPTTSASDAQKADYEQYESAVKRSLCEFPNYEEILHTLIEAGRDCSQFAQRCRVRPGIPCKPMLAKPTKSVQQILDRFQGSKFTCEYKYDGLRGQIHLLPATGNNAKPTVQIFSRNLENMTQTYPDIVELVLQAVEGTSLRDFIIDSEIVAFDAITNKIKSFQELSTRARKNVALADVEIKVCVFMFDVLYLNGASYLQQPLTERRQIMAQNFKEIDGQFALAQRLDSEDTEEIQDFLSQSIKVGCEGLMIKTLELNSSYEPAKRSFKWLKLKKDYLDTGLGDSLDLVPIAASYGTGKRKGLYGNYLLAAYNEDMETYETICKVGTGFSDENLEKFFKSFEEHIIKQPLPEYRVADFKADVWFAPSVVWEIKGADLQISPVYTAASSDTGMQKGIGLRFPRLVRVREDKKPNEATTSQQIYEIFKSQAVNGGNDHVDMDDDDYY